MAVDLEEVAKLVAALERDLAKLKQGTGDVRALQEEVRALGVALEAPAPDDAHINDRLKTLHGAVDTIAEDTFIAADYAAKIGRMLGM